MKQRTINVACLLLAVAGISFGIGQSVGQDNAQAERQSATAADSNKGVVRQLKKIHGLIFDSQFAALEKAIDIEYMEKSTCRNVRSLVPASDRDPAYDCTVLPPLSGRR